MKRRDFLKASALAGAATVCGTQVTMAQGQAGGNGMPKLTLPEKAAELNLCLQWGAIPGSEMKAKLDLLQGLHKGCLDFFFITDLPFAILFCNFSLQRYSSFVVT